jgi:chromosomal replication initiation ATPase DnaA
MDKKELLYRIKLYTGCDEYTMKRISLIVDEYIKHNTKTKIVKDIKYIDKLVYVNVLDGQPAKELEPIENYFLQYYLDSDVDTDTIRSKRRGRRLVRLRRDFAVSARNNGYTFTEIGHAINRDHTTILHYYYHYKI